MTTVQLGSYGYYTGSLLLEDTVRDYLGDYADSFDVAGLTDAYRAAINEALAGSNISLHGSDFYAEWATMPADPTDVVRDAIASVDLAEIAPAFDKEA